jgi:dihydrolipoamide dehydrogenase
MASDVIVIGGGPGGYVAAIRAAQLGLSTVCVEMDRTLGGTCVNVGCIPSKALLQSSEHYEFLGTHANEHGIVIAGIGVNLAQMMQRKQHVVDLNCQGVEYLFKKNKVTWARGYGTLRPGNLVEVKSDTGERSTYAAKDVILATGSVPIELPFLKFDEVRVHSNTGALQLPDVPKHLVVIGGGVIGLELGSVWRRLGARVTVVELMPTILAGNDAEVIKEATRVFKRQGMELRTSTKVVAARRPEGGNISLDLETGGRTDTIEADHVLVAIGRKPALAGIDARTLGLKLGPRGEVVVDAQLRTSVPHVYAIGDCTGGKLLAHKAEDEGVVAAELIAGKRASMHYHTIPSIVYTWPEIAAVGYTEEELQASGRKYKVGKFPFAANGRARTLGETGGFVKFIADERTDEILGCHMIGPNVSELIAEIVLAMEFRGTTEDIAMTCHSHPTLSEATKEAALAALGRTLHL